MLIKRGSHDGIVFNQRFWLVGRPFKWDRSISFHRVMIESYKHYLHPVAHIRLRSLLSSISPRTSNLCPMLWMALYHTTNRHPTSRHARLLFRLVACIQQKTTKCSWTTLMAMTWDYIRKLTFVCACQVNVDVQRNDLHSSGFSHLKLYNRS